MEGDREISTAQMGGGGSSFTAPVSSRWNPTKEQISILENLYKQGVRTPSAEQIQQITSRLKAYGHIEGKNVFYWFQNHKARQRQKQKQESLAYLNHFLHINSPHPSFTSQFPCPNVVCSPYYVHQNDVGFYPHYHNSKVLQTSGMVRRRSRSERRNCNGGFGYGSGEYYANPTCENEASAINVRESYKAETLSLFPTHPTGDLEVGPPPPPPLPTTSVSASSADDSSGVGRNLGTRNYFDFFL